MSEKTAIIDKLPPVADSSSSTPSPKATEAPLPETTAAEDTAAVAATSDPSVPFDPFAMDVAPAAGIQTSAVEEPVITSVAGAPEITITAVDKFTHLGLVALFIFFAIAAVAVFARRGKISSSAPKKALLMGGLGMIILSFYTFATKTLFAQFLNQQIESFPLWLKPLSWLIIAPILVLTIPYLVTESSKAHKFFLRCAAKAAGAFAILSVAGLLDLGAGISAIFSLASIVLGILFALPLMKALRRLPGSLTPETKTKISQLGFMTMSIIVAQIFTGGLALMNINPTPILLADLVVSFALMAVVLINLMSYISIQVSEEASV